MRRTARIIPPSGGFALIAVGAGGYLWRRPATTIERAVVVIAGLAVLSIV
jgi:hypothetical protein